MSRKWTAQDIPPLNGKVAIVTGANRGLGLEITIGLARAGATVVMACRNAARAQAAAEQVRGIAPGAKLELMELDIADLSSVRKFAEAFRTGHPKLDILVNNASAIMVPFSKTRDGFEMHIGTNLLGTFALTGLLLDVLKATPGSRIVNTASMAHKLNKGLDLDDLHFAHTPYKEMEAYGRSKLATLLYTLELSRRLRKAGIQVVTATAHPGWSNTNPDFGSFFMRTSNAIFAQSAAMGALPALYAATAPDVAGGEYIGPGGFQQMRGYPARVKANAKAGDADKAAKLWVLSEQLTGVRYLDG